MLGKVSHLIDVSFLSWTELSEHVPLEYAFETLLINLANAFLALDCCYCGSCWCLHFLYWKMTWLKRSSILLY